MLAIDLRFAGSGTQVHGVAGHEIFDVLALEHLDELTFGFFKGQVSSHAHGRCGLVVLQCIVKTDVVAVG